MRQRIHHSSHHSRRPQHHALYLTVACSLLGVAHHNVAPVAAFAATTAKPAQTGHKRERNSKVRLFSPGPDTFLSSSASADTAATLDDYYSIAHTAAFFDPPVYDTDAATLDPFDPAFRPPTALSSSSSSTIAATSTTWEGWGPAPTDTATLSPTFTTRSKARALKVAHTTTTTATDKVQIFCDLDGVLVDFEAGVQAICNVPTKDLPKTTMWQQIAQSNLTFFEQLPWTEDGPELWQAIQHLQPDILTGVPDLPNARQEKVAWCQQHLLAQQLEQSVDHVHVDMAGQGYNHANVNGNQKATDTAITNIITCWSYNKHHESRPGAILIDDRIALKEAWEAKGGIFVHHVNTKSTLQQLREMGVLQQEEPQEEEEAQSRRRRSALMP